MQVKRFRAPNMKEALEQIKKELGEEAVILKSEPVPNAGFFDFKNQNTIEVIAAVDVPHTESLVNSPAISGMGNGGGNLAYFRNRESNGKTLAETKARAKVKNGSGTYLGKSDFSGMLNQRLQTGNSIHPQSVTGMKTSAGRTGASSHGRKYVQTKSSQIRQSSNPRSEAGRRPSGSQNSGLNQLRDEVRELRSIIRSLNTSYAPQNLLSIKEFADMPAPYARVMMDLMERGIDKSISRMIIEKAASSMPVSEAHKQDVLKSRILETVSGMIQTAGPIRCRKGKSKVIALVGPTGVGKTTTLAKLAANSKFVFDKKVGLISADTYRMSAIEHLNTFAGIAHLPLSAVYSPGELKSALSAQKDKDLIFIDTAGRSPRDETHLVELKKFMECAGPDEIHLVLPANIKNMDLLDTLRRFDFLGINRIVISKVDETSTLGSILNITAEVEKPLSYITNGQTIPDDIDLANAKTLANLILRAA